MDQHWAPAIAILVALSVVAIFCLACYPFISPRSLMLVPAILGSWAAITAVVAGLIFTGWCFVGPPGANFDAWMEFVFYNVIIAAGSGIPAGLIGLVVVKLASPSQPAKPAATEPQPADTRARPIDTAFQRLDKREPEN